MKLMAILRIKTNQPLKSGESEGAYIFCIIVHGTTVFRPINRMPFVIHLVEKYT